MADLIDRDKLIQTIMNTHLFDISYGRKNGKIVLAEQISKLFSNIKNQLIAIIKSQPEVDTERHAHWIEEEYFNGIHYAKRYRCSKCALTTSLKHDYCHCGCKMDEEVNE